MSEQSRDPHSLEDPSAGLFTMVEPVVARLATVFVNLYAVDLPGGRWAYR